MSGNYYGCEGRHAEFTCLSHYYHNRKFIRARWCEPCKVRFPERTESV